MRRLEERFGRLFIRPVVITGELSQPGLGISDGDLQWIEKNCGSIIHSAANLLFRPASEHPDNEPYRTNLDGTRTLLDLTTRLGINEWHYISTAYVAGLRTGQILERETDVGQQFGNDYERSKTMAEQLLRHSMAIHSLTVCRPSIVIDLHPTSSMRSDQTINSAFVMFQALSQRFGLPERGEWFRRLGFSGVERKNIVTVDWVATMIAQIYRRPELHGQTYHLTSPTGTSAEQLEDAFRSAMVSSGVKLPARRVEAASLIDEHAAPFVAAFKPYFKDDPGFDRTNISHAMKVCGEQDLPVLSVEMLREFCLRQTKSVLPPAKSVSVATTWQLYASEFQKNLGTPVANGHASTGISYHSSRDNNRFGLELSGGGGGQWVIELSNNGIDVLPASSQLAPCRWISSAAVFGDLIEGRRSIQNAAENGLLVMEADMGTGTVSHTMDSVMQTQVKQFERLIAAVQRYGASSQMTKPEVANVG
jgi:nucleoside-diphosphate-sugar epimerase